MTIKFKKFFQGSQLRKDLINIRNGESPERFLSNFSHQKMKKECDMYDDLFKWKSDNTPKEKEK